MPRRLTPSERPEVVARLLRDRPGITAHALADDLGVSLRTIFRDLDRLRERGYPIDGDRGRGGGLRLHPHWGLPRLLLASDEALGALLALAVSERMGFPMFGDALRQARRKLLGAFSTRERAALAPLRERILVAQPASKAVIAGYEPPDPAAARHLQRAFVEARVMTMRYDKPDGASARRRVDPHALLINAPAWYLVAYDHDRRAARTFRMDRIRDVVIGDGQFRPWSRITAEAHCGIVSASP
jgi:predicted DNA-binding transcriptional regulator YafY